jgi:hypothetical protein
MSMDISHPEMITPKSMMGPPEVVRPGPASEQKKLKITKPPTAVGANGVAHGADPHRGRDAGRGWPGAATAAAKCFRSLINRAIACA